MVNPPDLSDLRDELERYTDQLDALLLIVPYSSNLREVFPVTTQNLFSLIRDRLKDIKDVSDKIADIASSQEGDHEQE